MSAGLVRVVKVGGSLLSWDGLKPALLGWLERQPPARTVLIAGCGQLADFIRNADNRFALGEHPSHWLCISLMSITARMLSLVLPSAAFTASFEALRDCLETGDAPVCIFDVEPFLRDIEPSRPGAVLPHNWLVTSDSIAARLAETLHAEELVLLKSADPPADQCPAALAQAGYVDPYFPTVARRLMAKSNYVNLKRTPTDRPCVGLKPNA